MFENIHKLLWSPCMVKPTKNKFQLLKGLILSLMSKKIKIKSLRVMQLHCVWNCLNLKNSRNLIEKFSIFSLSGYRSCKWEQKIYKTSTFIISNLYMKYGSQCSSTSSWQLPLGNSVHRNNFVMGELGLTVFSLTIEVWNRKS